MTRHHIRVVRDGPILSLMLDRPDAGNALSAALVGELRAALDSCADSVAAVVIGSTADDFSLGADFAEVTAGTNTGAVPQPDAHPLYGLLLALAEGPYMTIAHVRGRANAAGVGLAAACDIVIADESAQFSLSELLFGLYPACVLPFLIRRIGFQRAHFLTLSTRPVAAQLAHAWGLADLYGPRSEELLRHHLLRARRLPVAAIAEYKRYASEMYRLPREAQSLAVAANRQMFSDPRNLHAMRRFLQHGVPSESG